MSSRSLVSALIWEQSPACFDVREVLLALIFSASFFQQALLTPDAFQGTMTDGQNEFADQTTGPEGGQRLAQLNELRSCRRRGFLRLVMTRTGERQRPGGPLLAAAAPPFADSGDRGSEQARRGFDAALLGAVDQSQTMVVGVFHFTNQTK